MSQSARGPASQASPYPPEGYAWYVIGVLFVVTLLSQLDRQLPALLVKPLRHEFGLTDTGFSFLQGYAFALFYTFAGLPLGWLVDRTVRRNLIIVGILIWSSMTILAGFAQNYDMLLISRMGVGVGEAVLAPAAYSMIADYIAPERRGRALGVYYVSLAIGSGASLVLGGLIARLIPADGLVLPGLGLFAQWRLTFMTAGAPGALLALLLLSVREPLRRNQLGQTGQAVEKSSVRDLLAYLWTHISTYSRVLTYPAVIAVIGYGTLGWAPALFDRRFGMPMTTAGPLIGVTVAVGGLVGTLISGYLSDRWTAKGVQSARFRVTLTAFALILPTVSTWSLVGNLWLSLALFSVVVAGFSMAQASAPAVVQEITPNSMRGQVIAIYLLLGGLVGIGFGPLAIALVTDHILHSDKAIHLSLALVGGPTALLGLWLAWSGQKPYARTLEALRARAAGEAA